MKVVKFNCICVSGAASSWRRLSAGEERKEKLRKYFLFKIHIAYMFYSISMVLINTDLATPCFTIDVWKIKWWIHHFIFLLSYCYLYLILQVLIVFWHFRNRFLYYVISLGTRYIYVCSSSSMDEKITPNSFRSKVGVISLPIMELN